MGAGRSTAVRVLACGLALATFAGTARADDDETEAVPMPVARASFGFVSNASQEGTGFLGGLDLGVHVHYSHVFFGGELGWTAAETEKRNPTQFFSIGAPIGAATEEALFACAFVPRLLIGERESQDVVAFRIGGALYGLAGTLSFELAHERWLGDGGSAHLVGVFGVDLGRLIFLAVDEHVLDDIP